MITLTIDPQKYPEIVGEYLFLQFFESRSYWKLKTDVNYSGFIHPNDFHPMKKVYYKTINSKDYILQCYNDGDFCVEFILPDETLLSNEDCKKTNWHVI